MSLLLLKIPLAVVSIACTHICFTAPNTAAQREERNKFNGKSMRENGYLNVLSLGSLHVLMLDMLNVLDILLALTSSFGLASNTTLGTMTPGATLTRTYLLGILLQVSGTALRRAAYRALGRAFTFHLAIRHDHKLVTTGVYAYVRHPSYTAMFLFEPGIVLSLMGPGSMWAAASAGAGVSPGWVFGPGRSLQIGAWAFAPFNLPIVVAGFATMIVRCPVEDEVLRAEFGATWDVWAAKTRYRLFPYIY